jgi:hypothetical protein
MSVAPVTLRSLTSRCRSACDGQVIHARGGAVTGSVNPWHEINVRTSKEPAFSRLEMRPIRSGRITRYARMYGCLMSLPIMKSVISVVQTCGLRIPGQPSPLFTAIRAMQTYPLWNTRQKVCARHVSRQKGKFFMPDFAEGG